MYCTCTCPPGSPFHHADRAAHRIASHRMRRGTASRHIHNAAQRLGQGQLRQSRHPHSLTTKLIHSPTRPLTHIHSPRHAPPNARLRTTQRASFLPHPIYPLIRPSTTATARCLLLLVPCFRCPQLLFVVRCSLLCSCTWWCDADHLAQKAHIQGSSSGAQSRESHSHIPDQGVRRDGINIYHVRVCYHPSTIHHPASQGLIPQHPSIPASSSIGHVLRFRRPCPEEVDGNCGRIVMS
ncbi:hypothetical protein EDB80DRAFT_34046 [Ilyonectria destructans]|nr:hypothetical protein EDB80DRAFT_34046 [Ilyonectria destructans]